MRPILERHGLLVGLAAVLWLVAVGRFGAYGFSWHTLILWFGALVGVAQLARLADGDLRAKTADLAQELVPLAVLLAVFAPLYLLFLYHLPQQVNTDEISLMIFERQNVTRPINLLGVSPYFSFPALPFVLFSRLGLLLGGINLSNMRLVHAGFGLLIIVLGYALFRLHMGRGQALGAAIILGANHALLGISRLAQWDNLSLLAELAALIVLVAALRRGSLFIAVLGGFLAGLSFYVYLPGRITIVIWLLYLGLCWLLRRDPQGRRLIVRVGVASSISFLMIATPITVGQLLDTRPGSDYYKKQLLIFPEGRVQQKEWFRAETIAEGIWINVSHGLTAFNNQEHDRGFIYENLGHGFLDPLTGVLLWIGVFYVG
ncbi:MAG: glycosyltransferase family 39 protein, partial [Anaerolineales bacterium]